MGDWQHPPHLGRAAREFSESARAAQISVFVSYVLPNLRDVARSHGYTLAEHGSQARDLDLIAVPWTDKAVEAEELVKALAAACHVATGWGYRRSKKDFEPKPHGRVATTIIGSAEIHIDLSIMPRVVEPAAETE